MTVLVPDLLSFGEALIEFNQIDPADATRWRRGFGGDSSNAAIAAARMGARAGYVTAVGADAHGDALLDLWRAEAVDVTLVQRSPDAPTGVYFVTHGPDGHAFAYLRSGSAASRLGPARLPLDAIRECRVFHCSAISQAISDAACDASFAAMKAVAEGDRLFSYDTNLRLRLWPLDRARAIINTTAARADFLFVSVDEGRQLVGLDDPARIALHYRALGARVVVVKLGPDGALLAEGEGQTLIGGHRVEAVDATGAGDVFAGAFLARVLAGDASEEALVFANAAAALSTTGFGAVAPIPDERRVRDFLARARGR
jgi:2-dehydro-3-deoxygluconokinase